jgi:hypothetical protein
MWDRGRGGVLAGALSLQPWSWGVQYSQLMTQDQDLDFLGGVGTSA